MRQPLHDSIDALIAAQVGPNREEILNIQPPQVIDISRAQRFEVLRINPRGEVEANNIEFCNE